MGAILAWVANSWFGKLVLGFIVGKLTDYIKRIQDAKAAKEKKQAELKPKVEALIKAETKEAIDAAADDILRNI